VILINDVRRACYLDSVALMRHSKTLADMDGIVEAAMMMGTPANREIMTNAGLLGSDTHSAAGGDLIIGIRAENTEVAQAALAEANRLIDQPSRNRASRTAWRPRSIRGAVANEPAANLALISVSGDFAAAEARKAIRRGLHVMIFSNNVALADEVSLKREARALGCLVMGPDCGTSIINGVPLAFANKVPRGNIAIVGASGTGIQEVSCLIAAAGGGISHAIGVGGRDLTRQVGGISTLMALDALEQDSGTDHIVVISKPPAEDVTQKILRRIAKSTKTYTICFLGAQACNLSANARFASTLKLAAQYALRGANASPDFDVNGAASPVGDGRRWVRGLFCGGTLCAEAQVMFAQANQRVASNVPVPGASELADCRDIHTLIDFGEDRYTRGRPHPMIDPSVRDAALADALGDQGVAVILVDMVIGYGAHEDPAGCFVKELAKSAGDRPVIVASVTGTDADPQGRASQVAALERAGVLVAPSNADAARLALACLNCDG
jgi:succinyl-CoA synthetase alpha subunit